MMLTKKGSTRGTVSVLFLSMLIFLIARLAVNAIETAMPNKSRETVAWKTIPDPLKTDQHSEWFKDSKDAASVVSKAPSNESGSMTNPDKQSTSSPKLIEPSKTLTETGSNPEQKTAAEKPTNTIKNTSKKRFTLEKLFPDNVDQLPVLMFFADDGSPVSQKMENTSLGIKEIREKIEKEFYPVKIGFDKKLSNTEYRLYQEYGTTAVPVVHILTPKGKSLAYISGYISAVKVMVLLRNAQRKKLELDERPD